MYRISTSFALLTFALSGQQLFTNMSTRTEPGGDLVMTFSGFRAMGEPTGTPYSADKVFEHTQTLSDGTHIKNDGPTEHFARDSQGRWRMERATMRGIAGQESDKIVQIYDQVAGIGYILDDQNKIAHRVTPQTPQHRRATAVAGAGRGSGVAVAGGTVSAGMVLPNQPERSTEKLGSQTIEGITADGTRTTTTWPIGSRGNDRPLTDISETWFSPQLKATVLSKFTSLQNGESVTHLTNISLAEPDPMLFQPPADYKIIDDTDTVTITLKRH